MSSDSSRKQRSSETERDRIIEQGQTAPGVVDLMRLYEAAEAVYATTFQRPRIQVANSTNLKVHEINAKLG